MPVYKDEERGTWFVRCYYEDLNGKKKQIKKRGFKLQREAKDWETDFLNKQHGSTGMTFQSLYEVYIRDIASRYKASTVETKEYAFHKHILPYFGRKAINNISAKDIRAWQTEMINKGFSDSYLDKLQNIMVAIMNYAINFYDLPSNPCNKAGRMGKRVVEVNFWTIDEYNKILQATTDPMAHIMFQVLYYSGFRCGEFLALTPNDINFEANTISITKTLQRKGGQDIISTPKTPKSIRTILIPTFVMIELKEYMSKLFDLQATDRIFPFTKSYINGCIRRACKATGLKRIRIHDIRHSNASYLIHLGCSPLLISERLGHERVQTTLSTYSHLYPNKHQEVVDMMEMQHNNCS